MLPQTNFFRVFFKNNLKYCYIRLQKFESHLFELSAISQAVNSKMQINEICFVMIINVLHNENTVTILGDPWMYK